MEIIKQNANIEKNKRVPFGVYVFDCQCALSRIEFQIHVGYAVQIYACLA